MATKKRSGLGRGIGALIPTKPAESVAAAYPVRPERSDRPVDVFFPGNRESTRDDATGEAPRRADAGKPAATSSAATELLGELDGPGRAAAARRASSRSGAARAGARGKAAGPAEPDEQPDRSGTTGSSTSDVPSREETSVAPAAKRRRARPAAAAASTAEERAAEPVVQRTRSERDAAETADATTTTGGRGSHEPGEREEALGAASSDTAEHDRLGPSAHPADGVDGPAASEHERPPKAGGGTDEGVEGSELARGAAGESEGPQLVEVPGIRLIELDPRRVAPNLKQPRREFDDDALAELTTSVREFGVLQPIVVRSIPADHPSADRADYELIMGERRLRASRAAGLDAIPAIVRETADEDMLRDALLENIHRAELNPLEEASAYQQLLDDFGITQEELAQRIGRSRPQISNTIRLLKLPVEVQRRVAAGVLSAGHARAILSVGDPAAMTQLADKIVNEDLSVRAAEAAASKQASTRAGAVAPRRKPGGLTGYLDDCAERLGDRLNTRVRISLRKTKGQIVIDFAAVNDLNRILSDLGIDVGE